MSDSPYQNYKDRISLVIRETIDAMECQPIFFVGTGVSKRYFNAPNWLELLKEVAFHIGMSEDDFNYTVVKLKSDPIEIGNDLENRVFEWAWKGGKNSFPQQYFSVDSDRSVFLKYVVSEQIKKLCPVPDNLKLSELYSEIEKLKKAQPHAIITTNYDRFLEKIFPEYEPVVGNKIIRRDMNIVGEIFKIHGSVEEPSSIVITGSDYAGYREKKKYISAKLLTYLAEHPVFIFGYGLNDPDVSGIIEDIGEIICEKDGLIDNIFYVEWKPGAGEQTQFREEYVIGTASSQLRVRAIVTDEFGWIFDAISTKNPLKWVDPRIIRTISSRFYNVIRRDIPRSNVDIDFKHLASIADSDDKIPSLFGIGRTDSPNISYPYILRDIGKKLGLGGWHRARDLIVKLRETKGFDMQASDNVYHYAIKSGNGHFRRYSEDALELLKNVRDGKDFVIKADS